MPRTVNVNYITKEVKILLHDSEAESLAAATAIAAAESAQEAKDVVVDNLQDSLDAIDAKTETEKTELNSYTETKKTEIATLGQGYVDSASQKVDEANTILAAIRNEYGYPFTAATAAAMTDSTKIYVYTGSETGYTNGNWYYYDGTAWVSGGVYNAIAFNTDPTLTISGAAADAMVTGDAIGDINESLENLAKCNPTITSGKINSTGTIGTAGSNQEVYTSQIKCLPGQKLRFVANYTGNYTMWAFYATYDINGDFIERIEISTSASKNLDETITAGNNVYAIAFTYRTSNLVNSTIYAYVSAETIAEKLNDVKDYPNTKMDVLQLKKDIYSEIEVNPDDFATGTVSMSTSGWNYNMSNKNRVVTQKNTTIHIQKNTKISLSDYSNYRFCLGWRIGQSYYLSGWQTNDYITQAEGDYVILLSRIENEVELEDKFELLNLLSFTDLNSIEQRVSDLEKGGSANIINLNSDIKPILIQGLRRQNVSGGAYQSLPKVLSLLHFSDIHGDSANLARINEFRSEYAKLIDDSICTGDMVYNYYSDGIDFWTDSDEILMCIGNHDVRTTSGWTPGTNKSMAETYTTFFAPFIEEWDVEYTENQTYYYKDYSACQVRLIVLDAMLEGSDKDDQITWFENTLADALTNEYMVVVAEHYPVNSPTRIECTFTSKTNLNSGGLGNDYLNVVDSFINNGGIFGCWLCGHIHFDSIQYNVNHPKQMFVAVTCALFSNSYSDSDRVMNDKSQDAFNVVFVDKSARLIKVVRVGCDRDHYLRHMGSVVIDVSDSPTVIYND